MNDSTRQEHIAWCKKRALEYLDQGDITNAYTSMSSDLGKHREVDMEVYTPVLTIGMAELMSGNTEGMRRWIEGFN